MQVGLHAGVPHFPAVHTPDAQSPFAPQAFESGHDGAHAGGAQRSLVQTPERQSVVALHPDLSGHAGQVPPPQSTPVSLPFITPSVQLDPASCPASPPPPLLPLLLATELLVVGVLLLATELLPLLPLLLAPEPPWVLLVTVLLLLLDWVASEPASDPAVVAALLHAATRPKVKATVA
jgi:hypothetical protein